MRSFPPALGVLLRGRGSHRRRRRLRHFPERALSPVRGRGRPHGLRPVEPVGAATAVRDRRGRRWQRLPGERHSHGGRSEGRARPCLERLCGLAGVPDLREEPSPASAAGRCTGAARQAGALVPSRPFPRRAPVPRGPGRHRDRQRGARLPCPPQGRAGSPGPILGKLRRRPPRPKGGPLLPCQRMDPTFHRAATRDPLYRTLRPGRALARAGGLPAAPLPILALFPAPRPAMVGLLRVPRDRKLRTQHRASVRAGEDPRHRLRRS